MNQNPVVFYHASCADGFGAAFAAWMAMGDKAEYIPIKYGQINSINDVDLLGVIKGRDVFVLDLSFPRDNSPSILRFTHDTESVGTYLRLRVLGDDGRIENFRGA